jgi:glycosyltransferase involved in cell wall biosynthesis
MVIVGDGPERQAVEAAARGCDRVRIVGQVDSLADWLAVSSCFLSLSTFEGFGLAVGEALAAGLPTVSTATGIAPGLATTLQTDASAAEWAAAITTAKPLVQPEVILERFSVERMVSAWASVLNPQWCEQSWNCICDE